MKYIDIPYKGTTHRAIVDDDMYDQLSKYRWHYANGYAIGAVGGKRVFMHRIVAQTPDGMVTDHINHNMLDNRRSNLRVCTHADNMANRKYGVRYKKITNRGSIKKVTMHNGRYTYYVGEIRIDKKRHYTVTCYTEEQAQGALKQLVKQLLVEDK